MISFLEMNVLSWLAQVLIVGTVGSLLLRVVRIRHVRGELWYTYALLASLVVLPFAQTWESPPAAAFVPASPPDASFSANEPAALTFDPVSWPMMALITLVLGTIARLAWTGLRLIRIRAYLQGARPLAPAPAAVREAVRATGHDARFLVTEALATPATFGWREPTVLFPERFLRMESAAQLGIACHELLHVGRRDWLFTLVEELWLALFWFHPGVWWLVSRSRLARELLVDAEAARRTGDPESYVRALLAMAQTHTHRKNAVLAPSFIHPRRLAIRVRHLVSEVYMSRTRLFSGFAAIVLGVVVVTSMTVPQFPLLAAFPLERGAAAPVQDDDNLGNVVRRRALVPGPDLPEGGEVVVVLTFNNNGEIVDSSVVSGPDRLRQTALQSALLNNNYNVQAARVLQVVVEFPAASQTPSPPETLRVSAGVAQGNLLQRVQPVYPEAARTNGLEGTVILEATIGTDGRVTDIRVLAGHSLLASAALEAVRQWVYEPVLLNGRAVGIVTTVAVDFSLR